MEPNNTHYESQTCSHQSPYLTHTITFKYGPAVTVINIFKVMSDDMKSIEVFHGVQGIESKC